MTRSVLSLAAVAVGALSLAACGGGSEKANVRLLNVSDEYHSLDLYVVDDDSVELLLASGVGHESASPYAKVDSGANTLRLKRSGSTGTLRTIHGQFGKKDHVTYVAFGGVGRVDTIRIDDEEDPPDSGRTLVHVLHAAHAGTIDVYLTEEHASLHDQAPQFRGLASGGKSEFLEMDSGVYRLRVTGAGDLDDLRLDVGGVTLASEGVVAFVLSATPSGVLLNAVAMPQGGEPQAHRNEGARVRAAHGVSSGVSLTARVQGIPLLTAATAGALGPYTLVAAGAVPVELSIDGGAVTVPDQVLGEGRDFTLLFWNDDQEVRVTLIEDDNRLPLVDGKVKMRLVNGISGLGEPINLSIDYYPIAEGVLLGDASGYTETDSGFEDIQLDVISSSTAAPIWTREEVTLLRNGIYTLLMTGRDGSSINGTLRRDR